MNFLQRVWAWDGVDYLIQLALICVFAYGFVYASGANETLTESGCSVYWQQYNPNVNLTGKILVNETEADRLNRGGPSQLNTKKEFNKNFSKKLLGNENE